MARKTFKPDPRIEALSVQTRLFWAQACNWEGIHPSTPQAAFSEANPYQVRYRQAHNALQKLKYPETEKEE